MRIPQPPVIRPLQHLSPTIYEALLRCRSRAAWAAYGDRGLLPQHPKALLGTCLHEVVEKAHNGGLAGGLEEEARLSLARELFDRCASALYDHAHPLTRAKFSAPDRLPYYNLYRERAALEAIASVQRVAQYAPPQGLSPPAAGARLHAERRLVSSDGLLVGRPDLIDAAAQEVVDYKTGTLLDEAAAEVVSPAEARQLRLYVHLALDNGIPVARATIARADGRRAAIDVSREDADAEGRKARELLAEYNSAVGGSFDSAAQPSPENCCWCPCIPFCDEFWRVASPVWGDQCGVHLEGRVCSIERSTMQGVSLVTLRLEAQRGTVSAGETFVEQIPEAWITADGADVPGVGDAVRVAHGRLAVDTPPRVVRVDRAATSVWTAAAGT
jgi:hypothetical protein